MKKLLIHYPLNFKIKKRPICNEWSISKLVPNFQLTKLPVLEPNHNDWSAFSHCDSQPGSNAFPERGPLGGGGRIEGVFTGVISGIVPCRGGGAG